MYWLSSRDDIFCFTSFLFVSVSHGLDFDQALDQPHTQLDLCFQLSFLVEIESANAKSYLYTLITQKKQLRGQKTETQSPELLF